MNNKVYLGIIVSLLLGIYHLYTEVGELTEELAIQEISTQNCNQTITMQNEAIEAQAITMRNMDSAYSDLLEQPKEVIYKKVYAITRNKGGRNECEKVFNVLDDITTDSINRM